MKLRVYLSYEPYIRELEKMTSLFFEEAELDIQLWGNPMEENPSDALLRLQVDVNEATAQAEAELLWTDGKTYRASHQRRVVIETGEEAEVTERKQRKKALSYALLQVLSEATGVEQPWGILTGVRPTKLLHLLMEKGTPKEQALAVLQEEHLVTEEKTALLSSIVDRQLEVLPDFYELDREVSVYIGIPFCPTKCAYCTFPAYDIRGTNGTVEGFLEGLHYEIQQMGRWLNDRGLRITTLYFGGGTPTSIRADQLHELFQELHRSFPNMKAVRELTVEAGRPDTIDPEKIEVMKEWKVDRISINPQSFKEDTLEAIGRHHTVKETLEKFDMARSMGLSNINMDIIIGLPGEGVKEFQSTLETLVPLRPESLTVHTLSFKRASEMTQNREKYPVSSRQEIEAMMEMATDWTKEQGYVPYYLYRQKNILGNLENVGYSLPGLESLYNIVMMEERQTIIGLGCGAVSKIMAPGSGELERFPNPKEPNAYIQSYREVSRRKLEKLDAAFGPALSRA